MNLKSRKQNLSIQELKDELFVYDLNTDQVYSLNSTIAFVWNNLDGKTSVEEMSLKIKESFNQPVNEDFVWLAIDELQKVNLLEDENLPKAMSNIKRREAIKRVGLATMIALPVISMLIAPTALHAASGGVAICQPCASGANRDQGNCASGTLCINHYPPPNIPRLCGSNTDFTTLETGYVAGSFNSAYVQTSLSACNTFAARYCCKSSATFTGPNTCRCN